MKILELGFGIKHDNSFGVNIEEERRAAHSRTIQYLARNISPQQVNIIADETIQHDMLLVNNTRKRKPRKSKK